MPAFGTTVFPSKDTNTPAVPIPKDVLLTPRDFGFDEQEAPFAPKEIAGKLRVSSDEVLGLIESGQLRAFPVYRGKRTTYRVPYLELVNYFLRQQMGAMN